MPENSYTDRDPFEHSRLAGFVPSTLTAREWALARPVVLAAVAPFEDSVDRSFAGRAASALCRLLAEPGWDRSGPPDVAGLLTEERIDAAVASWDNLSEPSRVTMRATLRRVAAVVAPRTRVPVPRQAPAGTADWWVRARWCGPLPALVQAGVDCGLVFHRGSWNGAEARMVAGASLAALLEPQALCGEGVPGTVVDVQSAARLLRDASDVEGIPPMPASGPSSSRRSGSSDRSGDGVLRASTRSAPVRRRGGPGRMAELRRAAREAAAPPAPPALAALPVVPDEVAEAIVAYRPLKMSAAVWARIADATRWAFTAYQPPSPRWLSTHGGYVARFCAWVAAVNGVTGQDRLEPVALLGEGLIDRYLVTGLSASGSTVATVRSVLRRAVARMSDAPAPTRYTYQALQPPYSPAQCAMWVRLARHQNTRARRRTLSAAVALGLGAGLDSSDQRRVLACDVIEIDLDGQPALAVRVTGKRARTVVVRAAYEPLLREALALHAAEGRAPDDLLHGQSVDRLKVVAAVSDAARTAEGLGVGLSAARMRTTWLVAAACSPVPLAVLLAASGLSTGRTLADVVSYCPPPDPHEVSRLLHQLGETGQ